MNANRAQAERWVDALWGERPGHSLFAFGIGGHLNANEHYEFEHWHDRHGRWPDDRDRFLDEAIERASVDDVFVAPLLRSKPNRKRGSALPSAWLYADVDRPQPAILSPLLAGGGLLVHSGSGGFHVYLHLEEELEPAKLERLNRHLAHALQADSGWSETKLLRLPGTLNHKGRARGGESAPVRFSEIALPDGCWSVSELRDRLGPEPDYLADGEQNARVRPRMPENVPGHLRDRLDEESDEHPGRQSYGFVGACVDAGLADEEVIALALLHRPTREKFGPRAEREAGRALGKIRAKSKAHAGDDAAAERPRLTRIADVTPRRVEWLEENLIARDMLTGLVAPGGTVKGLYGIHEAAKLATRGERTLFVCSEDALDYIVRPRFQAADCSAELAYALSIETADGERVPRFPSDLPLLAQAVDEIEPLLAILDPVASYIDPGLDMGKNNEMRLILQPLITLGRDLHVAILVVYHLGKHRDRGAIGSVAFEDACRQVLTAACDDEDEDVRHVELTMSNIGPTGFGRKLRIVAVPLEIDGEVVEVAKLVDEGRSWKSVHSLLAKKGPSGPEPEKRKLARDLLVNALVAAGTSGVNAEEAKRVVAEKAGVSAVTVWRAFAELKGEELAAGEPIRDEFGSILEWRWVAKLALLVGRDDA